MQGIFMDSAIKVKIKYLLPEARTQGLQYSTAHAVGLDLRAWTEGQEVDIEPGRRVPFGTGMALEIETPGIAGFVFSRSGLGTKQGIVVSQGVGVIDPDYRGEIIVSLMNTSPAVRTITHGQRVAQLVFMPAFQAQLEEAAELGETVRGAGGFGHSGSH